MKQFKISVYDECLLNSNDLIRFLEDNLDETVLLVTDEGPSLFHCNVIKILDEHVRKSKRDPYTIRIQSENVIENTNLYTNINKWRTLNHFWADGARKYKQFPITPISLNSHNRLGCFIGRKNIPRLSILYWLRNKDCLLSSQDYPSYDFDILDKTAYDQWVTDTENFDNWCKNIDITSIDGIKMLDQYIIKDWTEGEEYLTPQFNLLNYYKNFDIEIVVETWTMGTTFFATEKTTRPLLGCKPMIIYGSKDYLNNLRQIGFKTWSSCWDETYDRHTGPQRWRAMQETINSILSLPTDEYQTVIEQAQAISLYNKQFYLETLVNKNPT